MAFKFNPFIPGNLDLVGTSSGPSPGGPAERFSTIFNATSSWTLASPDYTIAITAGVHGKGTTPNVQIYELVSGSYELVYPTISIDVSGNVTIKVNESPDTRFAGAILII